MGEPRKHLCDRLHAARSRRLVPRPRALGSREVRRSHRADPERRQRVLSGSAWVPRARHHGHRRRAGGLRVILDGVATWVGPEAVVVTAARELIVLSSAVVGGGFTRARAVLNVRVPKNFLCADAAGTVAAAARRLGVPAPWVGLLTGAWTERAEVASAAADDVRALVVATVGLSHPSAAGLTA